MGKIKDKSLKIKEYGEKFISEANDIISSFGKKLSDGIELSHKDIVAKLTPLFGVDALAALSFDRNNVTYKIDSKTQVKYSLTYMGYKEDIIVNEYTGQTEYSFYLDTNGLEVVNEYGSYFLADENGKHRASIGDIIIFTADEKNNTFAEMTVEPVTERERYKLTIKIDPEYLRDEKTAYPITIDPTLEIYYDTPDTADGNAIQDIMLAEKKTYSSTGTSLFVGKGETAGKIRTVMNFPGLLANGITSKYISSAHIRIRDLMCEQESILIQCYEYTGSAWAESAPPTWENGGNKYGELLDERYVFYGNGNTNGSSHAYAFDITKAAKKWAAGKASPYQGIMFKATNAVENGSAVAYKTFASFNKSSYQPRLVVNYLDISGISDFYTYDSKTLGDNLTIYTGHKYGTLTAVYNFPVNAGDFPLDVSYVYNSTEKGVPFYASRGLNEADYGSYGTGWKLSLAELLRPEPSLTNTFSYIYIDGTGVEYTLSYKSAGKFDNTEIGAELTVGTDTSVLKLADGTERTFSNTNYNILSLKKDDTVYKYNYTGKRLSSISKEGKTLLSFTYSSVNLIGINGYSIEYANNTVKAIKDKYGNPCTFAETSNSVTFTDVLSEYAYSYTLTNGRVTDIKYYRSAAENLISEEAVTYSSNATVYANTATVQDANDPDDVSTKYVFDHEGRTVDMIVTSADGSIIYDAQKYDYDENKTGASIAGAESSNLITNNIFSDTTGWTGAALSTDKALFSNQSAKLVPGQQMYYSIALQPGDYVLSAYINTLLLGKVDNGEAGGFKLDVLNSASNVVAQSDNLYLIDTMETENGTSVDKWVRVFLPFTIDTSGDYKLRFSSVNTFGNLYVDCVRLEKGKTPTTFNLLSNSDFENGITGWSGGINGSNNMFGNGCIAVAPNYTAYKTLYFHQPSNSSFTVSGWCSAPNGISENVEIQLTINYSNNIMQRISMPFTDFVSGKQFAAYTAESPITTESLYINYVTIGVYNGSKSSMSFDNLLLSFGDEVAEEVPEKKAIIPQDLSLPLTMTVPVRSAI